MAKFTPGPWEHLTEVIELNDFPHHIQHKVKIGAGLINIGSVGVGSKENETEKIAKLIAAAPEMYNALQFTCEDKCCVRDVDCKDEDCIIFKAINKAEGREAD